MMMDVRLRLNALKQEQSIYEVGGGRNLGKGETSAGIIPGRMSKHDTTARQ